jgi:hypothetical protein
MATYLRLADVDLETTGRAAYTRAASILNSAGRAAQAADCFPVFPAHLAALRDRNRRRPTLIAILDKAKLH